MKITTEEWNNFTPGIRMYKGEKTFFYNGEDDLYMPCDCWESDWPEEFFRDILSDGSPNMFWKGVSFDSVDNIEVSNTDNIKVIIVLPDVEVIYEKSFYLWRYVEKLIMSDSVKRIEDKACWHCDKLVEIKLSQNLEYIHGQAFAYCKSLFSMFLPETCRWIYDEAFFHCENLIIFRVYQQTMLGSAVLLHTALVTQSSYQEEYENRQEIEEIHEMIKAINQEEEYALHRICASDDPPKVSTNESVASIVEEYGVQALTANKIGITPLKYLSENPNCVFRMENVNHHKECAFGTIYDPYAFHRQCESDEPPNMDEILYKLKAEGFQAFCVRNEIGITPLLYLMANPLTDEDIKEITIVKRFILEMIG